MRNCENKISLNEVFFSHPLLTYLLFLPVVSRESNSTNTAVCASVRLSFPKCFQKCQQHLYFILVLQLCKFLILTLSQVTSSLQINASLNCDWCSSRQIRCKTRRKLNQKNTQENCGEIR